MAECWAVEKEIAEKSIQQWENHDRHRVTDGEHLLYDDGKEPNDVVVARALIACICRLRKAPTTVDVQFEYEDQLPKFDGSLFSAMYDASVVDSVRLYPFVVINEERFYLVKVPE